MRNDEAVRRAIDLTPTSLRALAIEAGLSPTLLRMVRDGERTATPATVEALAEATERMGGQLQDAAKALRAALQQGGTE